MMINKRLIGAVPESKKYIAGNVALQCRGQRRAAMVLAVREYRDDERRDGAARRAVRGQHDAE